MNYSSELKQILSDLIFFKRNSGMQSNQINKLPSTRKFFWLFSLLFPLLSAVLWSQLILLSVLGTTGTQEKTYSETSLIHFNLSVKPNVTYMIIYCACKIWTFLCPIINKRRNAKTRLWRFTIRKRRKMSSLIEHTNWWCFITTNHKPRRTWTKSTAFNWSEKMEKTNYLCQQPWNDYLNLFQLNLKGIENQFAHVEKNCHFMFFQKTFFTQFNED